MSVLLTVQHSRKTAKRDMKIINKMYDDYSIEVEVEYLEFISDANTNYGFCVQTLDDLVEIYNLDKSKKVKWDHTVYVFSEYFETSQLIRSNKLIDLLD